VIIERSGKTLRVCNVAGPEGVRGRNSDKRLIFEKLGWKPEQPLREGLRHTYEWIAAQLLRQRNAPVARTT